MTTKIIHARSKQLEMTDKYCHIVTLNGSLRHLLPDKPPTPHFTAPGPAIKQPSCGRWKNKIV